MSPRRASVKSFLAAAKKALVAPPGQRPRPLTFVVGNESADLDSLCSALILAYFRTHTPPHALHIPLSNLPRADLSLRRELDAALNPAGLTPDDLITLSDLPGDGLLDPQDTRWLLVDHNVLTGDLAASFSGRVVGCIDHHEDEGVVPRDLAPDQPRVFAKCGSCMSLVLDQVRSVWDELSSSSSSSSSSPPPPPAAAAAASAAPPSPPPGETRPPAADANADPDATFCDDGTPVAQCDAALARVALAPILLDTSNLASKDKTTDWDVRAAELALSRLRAASGASAADVFDRGAYYDRLVRLQEEIAGLSYRDVLRKDYKRWGSGTGADDSAAAAAGKKKKPDMSVGISTVVRGFEDVLTEVGEGGREGFLRALRGWAAEQRLDVAAVMTVSRPGGVFTRELLVWGLNGDGVRAVRQFADKYGRVLGLETWKGGELDGGGEGEGEGGWRVCWRQKSVEHSRKQVAPMLREALKESSRL